MISINEIYKKLLIDIYTNGETRMPRGMECKELRPGIVTLENSLDNIITLPGFETNLEYAKEELRWYLNGTGDINFSPLIKRVWEKFSDDGQTVNSNYGERIFGRHSKISLNQFEWVIQKLKDDPDSRQAVININSWFDKEKPTKDFPCTLNIQYFIVNNSLESIVYMRSNDIYLGFRNDVYCFTEIQKLLAEKLGVKPGKYYHIAGSMHLYKAQYHKVEKLLNEEKNKNF